MRLEPDSRAIRSDTNRARAELARVDHGREHVRGARCANGDDTLSESHATEQELERADLVAA
jgi:hypothetical protein